MNEEVNLVSVIIPNYNYASFLGGCIQSVLNQTYKNIEIIIIDDCSTDNSISIIQQYTTDKRVKLLKNEKNKGVCFSRNKGVKASLGVFISFLDPDDYWHPEKIEKQMQELILQQANLSFTDIAILKEKEIIHTRRHQYLQYSYSVLLKRNFIPHSSLIIEKKILEGIVYQNVVSDSQIIKFLMQVFGIKMLIHEDYALLLEIYRKKYIKTVYLPQPLVTYRIHNNNYSKNYIKKILSLYTIYRTREKYNLITSCFFTLRISLLATFKNIR